MVYDQDRHGQYNFIDRHSQFQGYLLHPAVWRTDGVMLCMHYTTQRSTARPVMH